MLEINYESKNTKDEIALLKSEGTKIEVKAQVRNIDKIENGIIIIVPSSTPNMSDELIYEEKDKRSKLCFCNNLWSRSKIFI